MVTHQVKTRRDRRRAETERRIIAAAISLLQKRSMSEITVEQITEAADVAKGTFFNYFASKEQVTLAAARVKREEFLAMTKAAEVQDVRGFLRDFTHRFLDQPKRTPTLIRNILGGALGTSATGFPFRSMMLTFREALTALMSNGQKQGQLRTDIPAERLAAAYQQCLFGTQAIWAMEPHPDDLHKRVDQMLEIFWHGTSTCAEVAPRTKGK